MSMSSTRFGASMPEFDYGKYLTQTAVPANARQMVQVQSARTSQRGLMSDRVEARPGKQSAQDKDLQVIPYVPPTLAKLAIRPAQNRP